METLKLDDRRDQIKLRYDKDDETELLIRVLSFGPVLEVKAPDDFRKQRRDRVQAQIHSTLVPAGTGKGRGPFQRMACGFWDFAERVEEGQHD